MSNLNELWNGISEEDRASQPIKPLWSLNLEDEMAIIQWFKNTMTYVEKDQEEEARRWIRNLKIYKGDHFSSKTEKYPRSDEAIVRNKKRAHSRYVFNDTFEIIEQWVSKMTGFKGNVSISPANDEHKDRQAARMAEDIVKYLSYTNNVESLQEKMARFARIFSEVYMKICWDDSKGAVHPDYKKAVDKDGKGKRVKLVTSEGEEIWLDAAQHIGDVDFSVVPPWQVFTPPCNCWREVDYVIIEERVDIDRIEAEYSDKMINLAHWKGDGGTAFTRPMDNQIQVYNIWHRKMDLLEDGRFIKIVGHTVLENTIHPYNHGRIPLVRLTDIDIPGEFRARSTVDNVGPLNMLRNKTSFLITKAMAEGSHLKWIAPKGSVNVINLGNTGTVVEYSGGVPPRLEMPRTTTPDMFQFRTDLRQDMERVSGVHGVSRGEPPPGIRAGIALQFLEEQENQRANSSILKHNAMIREVWKHALALVGQFYDESDERMINILGSNKQYEVKDLRGIDLSTPFDIRVQNASSLPDSKAGKIQSLIDLRETFGPGFVPDKQVADMIDLGQPEKYINWVTAASQKAEWENTQAIDGRDLPDPEPWEEQISHWQIHMKMIQSANYAKMPANIQAEIQKHIEAHELLMYEETTKITGTQMSQKLQALDGWPAFFEVPEPEPEQNSPANASLPVPGQQAIPEIPQPEQQGGVTPPAPVSPQNGVPQQ